MDQEISRIAGAIHEDWRGKLYYINGFDMEQVKRTYIISHSDTNVKRGWRGHRLEQRWFYVVAGSFEVQVILIDDWLNPNPDLEIKTFTLTAEEPLVLHIPAGYATGFQAIVPDSKIIVYADKPVSEAVNDDYQFPVSYFSKWN